MDVESTLLVHLLCGKPWIFFCVLCKKHNMKNVQNKSQTFIESPSKRLKEKNEVLTTVLQNVFSTAFFLMKEFTANRKLIPLTSFMERF